MEKQMIKAVIFDLDNSLYDENTYIQSGFRYVTSNLFNGAQSVYDKLWHIYLGHCGNGKNDGSYNIFQQFLQENGIYSREKEMEMTYLYRFHFPKIMLYSWVVPLFRDLQAKEKLIGIITNGRALVQINKLKALNIIKYTDKYIVCDILGEKHYKPFPMCYKILLNWMNQRPEDCLYIDDLQENIDTAKQLGMATEKVICTDDVPEIVKRRIGI